MSSADRLRIIVTGLITQHPRLGGVAWDYLQYPVGLARLGHDVYYFEDSGEWPYLDHPGPQGDWVARDCSENVAHIADVMGRFGLEDRWAYRNPVENFERWYGLPDARREEVVRTADLVLNVSGSLESPELYRHRAVLAYIDSDPVFTQVRMHLDPVLFRPRVDAHDVHFTFGERLEFGLPESGHDWMPTRQPILLDQWESSAAPRRDVFTTVMSWTSYEPLEFDGRTYSQKDVEFLRFLDLPERLEVGRLEIALPDVQHVEWERARVDGSGNDTDGAAPGATTPQRLLRSRGWEVIDATSVCATMDSYRAYLQGSYGEWSVAKNGYVEGKAGWLSGRSACYLAAGRPAIVQDTGFIDALPTGEGLLAFSTPDEALACIHSVQARYDDHAAAAREIARDHFASDTVLSALVEQALRQPVLTRGEAPTVPR